MNIPKFKTAADFAKEIENIATSKRIGFFEAVVYYCESNNIEVETVASIIKQSTFLKTKIQHEAEDLNMMKKTGARLPI